MQIKNLLSIELDSKNDSTKEIVIESKDASERNSNAKRDAQCSKQKQRSCCRTKIKYAHQATRSSSFYYRNYKK